VRALPNIRGELAFAERVAARMDELVHGVPRHALFRLAVLLHDIAKPRTKALKPDGGVSFYDHQTIGAEVAWNIAHRLHLSREACDYVRLIVREHMRPGQLNSLGPELSRRAIYRFFRATRAAGPDVLLHSLCDHMAMKGPDLDRAGWEWHTSWTSFMLHVFYEEPDVIAPEPLVRGDELIRVLGLRPGPIIGQLLEAIREAQAIGEIQTREEALERARQVAQSVGVADAR
jgi:putative nucleotidyltransferase with HDIG domain